MSAAEKWEKQRSLRALPVDDVMARAWLLESWQSSREGEGRARVYKTREHAALAQQRMRVRYARVPWSPRCAAAVHARALAPRWLRCFAAAAAVRSTGGGAGGGARAAASAAAAASAYDFAHFEEAQAEDDTWRRALAELRAGEKETHWMWFVFPQLAALGRSPTARHFGLAGAAHAAAYLAHEPLGARLRAAAAAAVAAAAAGGRSARDIFGGVDAVKLRSSLTLFEAAAALGRAGPAGEEDAIFTRALDALCDGQRDELTLGLLREERRADEGEEVEEAGQARGAAGAATAPSPAATAATAMAAAAAAVAVTQRCNPPKDGAASGGGSASSGKRGRRR